MSEMTSEADILSRLIGDIYDAALQPTLWPDTIRRAAIFVGGSGAALFSKSPARRTGEVFQEWGVEPQYKASYFETYIRLDPATIGQFVFDVGDIYSTADVIPYGEFRETRFYQEWAQPQGWVDTIAATLEKSATSFALFGVFRDQQHGLVDAATRHRMGLMVPHLRRAVLIGNVIDLHDEKGAMLADAFDTLAAGVFLVDEHARIVFANAAGQALLGEATILHGAKGVLTMTDTEAGRAFRDAIQAAAGGDAVMGAKGVAVPLSPQPDRRWLAHILPLTSGARQHAGIAYAAVAAVFVRKAALDTPSPMQTVARLYKLTPSELRVLGAIIEVGGVSAVADALGISEATVKTHLQHLFEKTGLRRQTDLVKLVAGHANPLRD
jgi:DNA-binding NarL/FixJ family response regulator